jgi:hypothetical protein
MSNQDIEELRQQTSPGERSQGKDVAPSLEDDLVDGISGVKDGSEPSQVAVRDTRLVALANTLDDRDGDYDELVAEIERSVDSTPDLEEGTKAYLIALLARAGLQACGSDHHEVVEEAAREYASKNL